MSGVIAFDALDQSLKGRAVADVACPLCGPRCTTIANMRAPKLRVWRNDEGMLGYHCARCEISGAASSDRQQTFDAAAREAWKRQRVEIELREAEEAARRTAKAIAIWREARPITGTVAETYLASRGLSYHGEALRWHLSCPFGGARHGCMVGLVRNIVTNEPQAIHRTAIDDNGRKIGRKAYGPVAGGAIKLTSDDCVTVVIAIGEGIETILSIPELPALSNMPVWSLISAGGVTAFPALPGIESVWIVADNDASKTGQHAARAAVERLNTAGVETIILTSTRQGADLNDLVSRHG
jgi:hypothetical protein